MRIAILACAIFVSAQYASTTLADPASKQFLLSAVNRTVTGTLPDSQRVFPPGAGADIANSQCMICHSAGMITRQPRLSIAVWTTEINKMRTAYGAPIPDEQVETLAKYLATLNMDP
jgi:mono/diheme cytochrome c family protein